MDCKDFKINIEEYIMSEFKNIYFEKDKIYGGRDILNKYTHWRNLMYSEDDLVGVLFYKITRKEILMLIQKYELFVEVREYSATKYKCNYISNSSSSTCEDVEGFV